MTHAPGNAADSLAAGRLFVITGAPAAGKRTTGRALANALERSVFIDGDSIDDHVVSGGLPWTSPVTVGALQQRYLRYAGAMALADVYRTAGFDVVLADAIVGRHLEHFLQIAAPDPVHLVVLHPGMDTLDERDATDPDPAYSTGTGFTVEELWHAVDEHTPHVGLWLDNSNLSPAQTITRILRGLDDCLLPIGS